MPRKAKGPRLHKFKHREHWYIRDTGQPDRSTGCASRADAEKALGAYIATKGREGAAAGPEAMTCAGVLDVYARGHATHVADPARIGYAIDALLPFWSELKVADIKGETCRRYAKWRDVSNGTARRELGVLQAAVNYAQREGYLTDARKVTLPAKPEPRQRWLTRDEAARLIWAAYRGHKASHVARFILIGLYTGTRKDAILRMGFQPNTVGGWFDLDAGLMYRMGEGERATAKRRTPCRIPRQLSAHLRRWQSQGCTWAVEYQGARVGDVKRGFAKAVEAAKLDGVTPHTLKHTAITWVLRNGATIWDAAGFFGTSAETIEKTYGHHSPMYQETAVRAAERK